MRKSEIYFLLSLGLFVSGLVLSLTMKEFTAFRLLVILFFLGGAIKLANSGIFQRRVEKALMEAELERRDEMSRLMAKQEEWRKIIEKERKIIEKKRKKTLEVINRMTVEELARDLDSSPPNDTSERIRLILDAYLSRLIKQNDLLMLTKLIEKNQAGQTAYALYAIAGALQTMVDVMPLKNLASFVKHDLPAVGLPASDYDDTLYITTLNTELLEDRFDNAKDEAVPILIRLFEKGIFIEREFALRVLIKQLHDTLSGIHIYEYDPLTKENRIKIERLMKKALVDKDEKIASAARESLCLRHFVLTKQGFEIDYNTSEQERLQSYNLAK